MKKGLIFILIILFSTTSFADSFRCKRSVVKTGDSVNALVEKCGKPVRKYSTYVDINENGRRYNAGVTNWVYDRSGKKDMIVSVRYGVILKIEPD